MAVCLLLVVVVVVNGGSLVLPEIGSNLVQKHHGTVRPWNLPGTALEGTSKALPFFRQDFVACSDTPSHITKSTITTPTATLCILIQPLAVHR
jgi:hypothetical protein